MIDIISFSVVNGINVLGGLHLNVYDFDGTLYDGDCMVDLYKYCLKRRPYILVVFPSQFRAWYRFRKGKIDHRAMKQKYYRFFRFFDMEKMSRKFWDDNQDKVFEWYKDLHRDDDLVISASPFFHVKEICSRLGIENVIASDVDPVTGQCLGPNCRDEEKVRRFREEFGDAKVDCFYSDSDHDAPMARLAEKAFMVKDGEILDWKLDG